MTRILPALQPLSRIVNFSSGLPLCASMPATLMAVTGPVLDRILGWLILTACLPVAVLPETRVWQAGGSPALAARGKCWLDGECVLGSGSWSDKRVGGQWLSQDDVEESYEHLGVGRDENACLARAKHTTHSVATM